MGQPRRTQPSRNAHSAPKTSSLTSSQSALNDDVPQVLEPSILRLPYVKQYADGITGPGILVKLFAVPRKDARSVDDPKRTLWFVGSPDSTNWTPRNSKDAHEVNAKATDQAKASNAVKANPPFKHRVKAKLTRVKAVRQEEQRSPTKGEGKVNEQQVQESRDDSDDASDNQEEEEENDAGEHVEDGLSDSEEEEEEEEEGETVVANEGYDSRNRGQEEGSEEDIYESQSDCIIIASSRAISK
jgi:hypothetical protein